jgi:hypothetical protein
MSSNSNQSVLTSWSAIIGLVGVIIGAFFGYSGTKESAQSTANAQITAAAINIFGPISATQTAEAKLIPVTPSVSINAPNRLLLESISQEVFSFQGIDNQTAGNAYLRLLYALNQQPTYTLIYDLPTDNQYGEVGLAFRFNEVINVSEYKSLDFTIRFDSANQSIDLFLVDGANIKSSVPINSTGKNAINVSFPFINFTDIELDSIKEINYYTNTHSNHGYHKVIISNIRFEK